MGARVFVIYQELKVLFSTPLIYWQCNGNIKSVDVAITLPINEKRNSLCLSQILK